MSLDKSLPQGTVTRFNAIQLAVTTSPWPFVSAHRTEIERHWAARSRENPAFFNGKIFVLRSLQHGGDRIDATFSLEDFAAFLYWRDHPQAGGGGSALDGFASAIVRSAEGHVMLGRHIKGTLNGGMLALPGGFLDSRDALEDATIGLDLAVGRELQEETGLDPTTLDRTPGYLVARMGRACSFAIEYAVAMPSEALMRQMIAGLARSGPPELSDVIAARSVDELATLPLVAHARLLASHVLARPR